MMLVCFKEGPLYISLLHFVFTDEIILMAYMTHVTLLDMIFIVWLDKTKHKVVLQ